MFKIPDIDSIFKNLGRDLRGLCPVGETKSKIISSPFPPTLILDFEPDERRGRFINDIVVDVVISIKSTPEAPAATDPIYWANLVANAIEVNTFPEPQALPFSIRVLQPYIEHSDNGPVEDQRLINAFPIHEKRADPIQPKLIAPNGQFQIWARWNPEYDIIAEPPDFVLLIVASVSAISFPSGG